MMKTYQTILYVAFLLLSFASCSKEDDLQPSGADKNYFAPDENATDAESVLRRDFYKKDSCYVLFNDTLRHEVIGKDANGVTQYLTETVDLPYVMTSSTLYAYQYKYLTSISDKQAALSFVDKYMMPHLSAALRPFSWLLVNHITKYSVSDGMYYYNSEPSYAVGNRTTAIALEALQNMTENEKSDFAKSTFGGIIANKVVAQTDATLQSFIKYSSSLYSGYATDYVWTEEENLLAMYKAGFVTAHYYDIYLLLNSYPSKEEDIISFAKMVISMTDSEVNTQFADYPTILSKYTEMKKIITNLGYIF